MPIDYKNYPDNWKTWIRPQVLRRAGNRCEACGKRNLAHGYYGESGTFYEVSRARAQTLKAQGVVKPIMVVLTVAHLDHDTTNNDLMEHKGPCLPRERSNLRAWYQKCHNAYDAPHRKQNAARTRRRKVIESGQPDLPGLI